MKSIKELSPAILLALVISSMVIEHRNANASGDDTLDNSCKVLQIGCSVQEAGQWLKDKFRSVAEPFQGFSRENHSQTDPSDREHVWCDEIFSPRSLPRWECERAKRHARIYGEPCEIYGSPMHGQNLTIEKCLSERAKYKREQWERKNETYALQQRSYLYFNRDLGNIGSGGPYDKCVKAPTRCDINKTLQTAVEVEAMIQDAFSSANFRGLSTKEFEEYMLKLQAIVWRQKNKLTDLRDKKIESEAKSKGEIDKNTRFQDAIRGAANESLKNAIDERLKLGRLENEVADRVVSEIGEMRAEPVASSVNDEKPNDVASSSPLLDGARLLKDAQRLQQMAAAEAAARSRQQMDQQRSNLDQSTSRQARGQQNPALPKNQCSGTVRGNGIREGRPIC